jgi:membrane protease YdiL (CAAX protease family)
MEYGAGIAAWSQAPGDESAAWFHADTGAFWALTVVICGALELAIVAVWLLSRHKGKWREALAIRLVPMRALAFWGAAAVLFAVLCDTVTWLFGRPIVPEVMRAAYATVGWPPLFWLALVGVAPLVEEVVFRGLLFGGVEASVMGPWGAIGLSTALWAATHAQYDGWSLLIVVLAGVLLGWARSHTRSVVVTWFMHTVLNAIAVVEAMLATTAV